MNPLQPLCATTAQPEVLECEINERGSELTIVMDRNGENYEEAEPGDVVQTFQIVRVLGHHQSTFCTQDSLQRAFDIIDSVKAIAYLTNLAPLIHFWNTPESGQLHDGTEFQFRQRQVWNTHNSSDDVRRLSGASPVLATLMMRAGAPIDPKLRLLLVSNIEGEVQGPSLELLLSDNYLSTIYLSAKLGLSDIR